MHKINRAFVVSTSLSLVLLAAITASAQKFHKLIIFDNGDYPYRDGLVQGTDGYLYGTTEDGGTNDACGYPGCGTIFKITPSGNPTALYSFCAQTGCPDGAMPYGGLVQGLDGNFYGTTFEGGNDSEECDQIGCGTVFRITPEGVLTTLHVFSGSDGAWPTAGLIQATDGNLYGTTELGGANGSGVVFRITTGGTLTTVYSFCPESHCPDGKIPLAGVVEGFDGSFYGTTERGGGSPACESQNFSGCGTVFRLTASGVLTTLHRFHLSDGAEPESALVQGTDGNFYGTTIIGGNNGCDGGTTSCGTIFKITPSGAFTSLYLFCSEFECTDGFWPQAGLMQGSDGNLYGDTVRGGYISNSCPYGCGTLFEITPSGMRTTLYEFGYPGPDQPEAPLAQDTSGLFYGSAPYFTYNYQCDGVCGEIFTLSVGLGPFVEAQPTSGTVGRLVKVLGTNLTGATSVTFSGTSATFTVVSPSLITTTVPVGATTGTVQVLTPGGTLNSNVPFRVLP